MKQWWKSRTLWFNAAVAAGAVVEANFPTLQSLFGPTYYVPVIGLVAGVNSLLRFLTTQPIVEQKGDTTSGQPT